ncbi:MAG: M48 family metallopeptidase [Rhodoferax sp.]
MWTSSISPAQLLTLGFCGVLLASVALRLWLAARQIRHVARHRDTVPADFADTIDLPTHQKAADYTVAKLRLGHIDLALGTALTLGWTLLGGLAALDAALRSLLGDGLLQQLALVAAFATLGALLEMPLSWVQTFGLEARFGFNKTTPRLWLSDQVKGAVLIALLGLPLLALLLWLMASAGSTWWLWAWGLWMGFNALILVVYPTLIAPLFNRFEPLADAALAARVQALMQRCGFSAKGLYVMDGSRRSAHANAYFTGFGAAKRVVFFDTLLQRLSPDEVDAVLAHELGHYKHRHIVQRMVMMGLSSLGALALLGYLSSQSWFYLGLGVMPRVEGSNEALALLLFGLALPPLGQFVSPLTAQLSRRHEFQADAYAVTHTRGADLASALLKLYQDNAATLTPDPLYVRFYYSHPSASERLANIHVVSAKTQPAPAQ